MPRARVHGQTSNRPILAYGETLSAELRIFNIRVTIVAPGAFDTAMSVPPVYGDLIPEYDDERKELYKRIAERRKARKGDPEKGMDAVVDLVHGEGRAAGKEGWPLWLFLGDDCIWDLRVRARQLMDVSVAWEDVGSHVGKDEGKKANL